VAATGGGAILAPTTFISGQAFGFSSWIYEKVHFWQWLVHAQPPSSGRAAAGGLANASLVCLSSYLDLGSLHKSHARVWLLLVLTCQWLVYICMSCSGVLVQVGWLWWTSWPTTRFLSSNLDQAAAHKKPGL